MSRRFQFSLRALLALTAAVAVFFAVWIRLPTIAKLAVVVGGGGFLLMSPELLFAPLAWIVGKAVGIERQKRKKK
jgi:hypothetical protein